MKTDVARDYARYCRPGLVELLEALSLDAVYERAEGDWLWQEKDGTTTPVLDLVGGFGANLFGHHHPELVAEDRRLLDTQRPILAQGSCRAGAAALAKALSARLGDYITIFTNSGAETVEAALKHAFLERRRPIFWATEHAFHGKTLGAIQLTHAYREPYSSFGPQVRFLDVNDPASWAGAEAEADQVSAAHIEPIQGEGGVRPLPRAFAAWLQRVCQANDIPLVADEIQTGMGRTGTFLASEWLGLDPDYICLSKALGGGMAKIGALLIKRRRFVAEFSVKHTSTFAEDDRSCFLALKALELLERDHLAARCEQVGGRLLARLEELRARFPEQIKEIRGRGLMIGVELQDLSDSPSNSLRMLSQQEFLGYLATAYLLHEHRIRVAPTLSQRFTIRIEPSAYVEERELERFVHALATMCEALQAADISHLTAFQVGMPAPEIARRLAPAPARREPARTARRVAFLGHLILPEHAHLWDPALKGLPVTAMEEYMARPSRVLGPTIFEQLHVQSDAGGELQFTYIGLDLTPAQIMRAFRERDTGWILERIEEAVGMAHDAGCQAVGLGAYTSIVTGNCLRVKAGGVALTTGNSLTVGMGIEALQEAAAHCGIELARARLAIVGATGNIAATYAVMMAPKVRELVLLVRDAHSPRLRALVAEWQACAPATTITVEEDFAALRRCELVVAASNSPTPLITADHLGAGKVVVCDISVPSDVAPDVKTLRPDVVVLRAGVVRLPRNPEFAIAGLPLNPGHVYACMAETMLMGFSDLSWGGSRGPVTRAGVEQTLAMARHHGFALGDTGGNWLY